MNDSSTGGYLAPSSTAPVDDDGLDDVLQALVVGITGMDGTLVRPRFQLEPTDLPDVGTNWCAIGALGNRQRDNFPSVVHSSVAGVGHDTLTRNEQIEVLASFYGPNASAFATLFADGLLIGQNREPLFLADMALVSIDPHNRAPELIKNQWLNRYDLPFYIRRAISRTYPVLDVATLQGTLTAETVVDALKTH